MVLILYILLLERNIAKNGSTTPTPISLSHDSRLYASLPSKSTQLKAKHLQTENKTKTAFSSMSGDTNERQNETITSDNSNDISKKCEKLVEIADENVESVSEYDSNAIPVKVDNSKYWAITSV